MKKILSLFTLVFFFLSSSLLFGQIGGDNTYAVLDLTPSPRIAAMGGDFLTINDNDILLTYDNPGLINANLHNDLGVSFVNYYSGINYGLASYARTFSNIGSFVGSMKYINYGTFDGADATGTRTGNFYSSEIVPNIGWGRQLDSLFSIGANVKFIYASMESYTSYGLAVDVAGSYTSRDRSFTTSLILKNMGRQLKAYHSGNIEPLPFEIQIGIAKRLKHLPFRYSVLYNHLEKWNLRYEDPNAQQVDPITGETIGQSGFEEFADNFMRHLVFGGELLIGKNIIVRGGYNYQRRQEMKIESKPGTIGFSWGAEVRISKFHFSYARSTYHAAGSPNYIAVTTSLSDFFVKKSN
ncbi:MAG: type IX secretion system protein PorQ [Bacteroidales bacterium]